MLKTKRKKSTAAERWPRTRQGNGSEGDVCALGRRAVRNARQSAASQPKEHQWLNSFRVARSGQGRVEVEA